MPAPTQTEKEYYQKLCTQFPVVKGPFVMADGSRSYAAIDIMCSKKSKKEIEIELQNAAKGLPLEIRVEPRSVGYFVNITPIPDSADKDTRMRLYVTLMSDEYARSQGWI